MLCVNPGTHVVGIAAAVLHDHTIRELAVGTIPKGNLLGMSRSFRADLVVIPDMDAAQHIVVEAPRVTFARPVWNQSRRTLPPSWRRRIGVEAKNAYRILWAEIEARNLGLSTRPVRYSRQWLEDIEGNGSR
jgi:hypothetical protein